MGNMTTAQKWGTGIGAVAGAFGGNPVAGGIIGNTIGGFFGGGDDKIAPRPDYPYMSAEKLYNWSNDSLEKYPYEPAKPYGGQLSSPMTNNENMSQNMLSSFMQQPQASSLSSANKYNTDVLSGKYNPRDSEYYKDYKRGILKDAEEAGGAIRHNAARSGMLHSDPRHDQERKLNENVTNNLSTFLGQLYENERGRMGTAAGQAPGMAQMMQQLPLQQISAGSTVGAIPREVDQAGLDRDYGEFNRQTQGAGVPLQVMQGLSGKSYDPYNAQSYTPGQGQGEDMAGTLTKMLPYIMMLA